MYQIPARCGQLPSTSGRGSSATQVRSASLVTCAFKRNNNQRLPPGFIDLPPLPPEEAAKLNPQLNPQQQPRQPNQQQPRQPNQQQTRQPNQQPPLDPFLFDIPGYAPAAPGYIDVPRQPYPNRRNNNNNGYQTYNDPVWGAPPSQRGGGYRNNNGYNRNQGFPGFIDDPDAMLLQSFGDTPFNMYEDWYEEVPADEDDLEPEPRYVNGKRVLVNREITATTLRVQDANKDEIGIMSYDEARELSVRSQADVVMVNESGEPPVVRIIEFGKYKFELERAAKTKQKSSKGVELKEVRLRPVTEPHDYEVKVKAAKGFLAKGSKVKLTMQFSGREMRFKEQGKEMMLQLIEDLSSVAKMEAPLSLRSSTFSVTLCPVK